MADFIRGAANFAFGGSRSSTNKDKEKPVEKEKEKLHASPSTGSDDNNGADQGQEEFDPFTPAETDDVDDGPNNVSIVAPPEKEYEYMFNRFHLFIEPTS